MTLVLMARVVCVSVPGRKPTGRNRISLGTTEKLAAGDKESVEERLRDHPGLRSVAGRALRPAFLACPKAEGKGSAGALACCSPRPRGKQRVRICSERSVAFHQVRAERGRVRLHPRRVCYSIPEFSFPRGAENCKRGACAPLFKTQITDLLLPRSERFHRSFQAFLQHPLRPTSVVVVLLARLSDAGFDLLNPVTRYGHRRVFVANTFADE